MTPRRLHHQHHRRQFFDLGGNDDSDSSGLSSLGDDIQGGLEAVGSKINNEVSVIFVTEPQTFSGSARYVTVTSAPQRDTQAAAPSTTPDASSAAATTPTLMQMAPPTTAPFPDSTTASTPSVTAKPKKTSSFLESFSTTSTDTPATTVHPNTAISAPQSSNSATVSADRQSTGLSGGAKAGIAIGVILAILGAVAIAVLLYRRRGKQDAEAYSKPEDEKKNPFGDNAAVAPHPPTAPQMTQRDAQVPNGLNSHAAGAGLAGAAARANASPSPVNAPRDQDLEKANPFGNHAAVSPAKSEIPAPLRINTLGPEGAVLAAGAGAVAGVTLAQRQNIPKPIDTAPGPISNAPFMGAAAASPATSQFSMNSISSGAVVGGAAPSNVHRIQLDFKPSMEDELELKAGQLVRLLHEYDDGWALCIRLDRSQQGVAPRTCLSTRPVKPRSNPPPGTGPPGMRLPIQRPESPASRSASAAPALANGPPRSMSPRPNCGPPQSMSPGPNRGPPRSMSPGPYGGGYQQRPTNGPPAGRQRSNSTTALGEKRTGPAGPSPMNPNAPLIAQSVPSVEQASTNASSIAALGTLPPRSPVVRKPLPGVAA